MTLKAVNIPMFRLYLLSAFSIISSISGFGQKSSEDLIKDIAFFSDVMVNADDVDHRMRAHASFEEVMKTFLESKNSSTISIDSIPWISVLHGPDFRLVTWQLRVSDEEYKYGGFIQWSQKIVNLKDSRPWVNGSLRNTYQPNAWYGALYYKLIPFKSGGKDQYIIFGFNAENSYVNTKVADVLDLSGEEPKFGAPVFAKTDDPQTRLILTYSDASSVQLYYDEELDAIVHDHLENIPGVGPEGGSLAVSDGSQEGWILKKGIWTYQEEMYDIKSEEPPMTEERKARKEDKDLMGRPKKE